MVHSFYKSAQPSGESSVVSAEVAALRRAGHDVALFAAHTDDLERDRFYPVKAAWRVATGRGASPLEMLWGFQPDVVHVHNLFPNFGRRWVKDVDVPLVHTLHNFRPLCANGLLLRDGSVCMLCPNGDRWAGLRHGCYRSSRVATLPLAWANRKGPMSDPLLRRANRLIVLSDRQLQVYRDAGVPHDRLVLSPNFLPDELDPGRSDVSSREGWLFVGRLSEEKGITQILEIWPRDVPLTVVGDGPQRSIVERLAVRCEARVLGKLPRSEVIEQMRLARGLIFPSVWYETFGMVYAEALAAGLPAVAFEPSTVAAAVRREGTGTVSRRTTEAVADALSWVRENERALRFRCRQVFEASYNETEFCGRTIELYKGLSGQR